MHPLREGAQPWYSFGCAVEIRYVAFNPEHPVYERQRRFVFPRIAVECDDERPRIHLGDTSDYWATRGFERSDILSIRCKDIDDICREAP